MTFRAPMVLAITSLLAAGGCARSARVVSVHVEEPGTHIVSGDGTISIARTSGGQTRVCTRSAAQTGKKGDGRPGPRLERPGDSAANLDALLFRLCEARGNGDIGAEQYAASVQTIMKTMEEMAARPRAPAAPRVRPEARDPGRMPPGARGRGWWRRLRRAPAAPAE
jgi:hypothetical protein